MIQQVEITLKPKSRGFHLVTNEILSQLPKLPLTGIMNIFCKHTSCGLSIKSIPWKVLMICQLMQSPH